MPEYTTLAVPGLAGNAQLTDQLRSNMVMFIDWALLSQGYFMNVNLNTVYPYGGRPAKLRPSDDNRYPSGVAWDGAKLNWCWEQGVEFTSQPINISGIYVNNNFLTLNNGYSVNYPLGRIIFNNPIPINSTVQIEYSYKYYNTYPSTAEWFRQLTEGTWRIDDSQFSSYGSGIWSIFPDSRVQLPAIAVEISPTTKYSPYGLGGGQWITKDVLFHCFAETAFDRDNFIDIISYQKWKKAFIVDKNTISKSGAFPLNVYGNVINPSSIYPFLVSNYVWTDYYIEDVSVQRTDNNPQSVYYGVCRWSCKINSPWAV